MNKNYNLSTISFIPLLLALMFTLAMLYSDRSYFILGIIASVCFLLSFVCSLTIILSWNSTSLFNRIKVCVSLYLCISCFFLLLIFWDFCGPALEINIESIRKTGLKDIAEITLDYCAKNNGLLPEANNWTDVLLEHGNGVALRKLRRFKRNNESDYAFNENISGMKIDELPGDIVLFFEAEGDLNLSDSQSLIDSWKDRRSHVNVVLLNKKVQKYWYDENKCNNTKNDEFENVSSLKWKP